MNAAIVTIGDELLIGQVINTNQAYIATKLNSVGVAVDRMLTVGDTMDAIQLAFKEAWSTQDIVVVTGGLGPTHDDITKKAVCEFFLAQLEFKQELRDAVGALIARRGIAWKSSYEEQAMFPAGAIVIPNPVGTAAGIHFAQGEKHFFVLPGVPYEMKEMIDHTIIPFLASSVHGTAIKHRTLRTIGATESHLAEEIGDVNEFLGTATLAFLPSSTGVRLRISVHEPTEIAAEEHVNRIESRLRERIGSFVYGIDDEEIQEVLGKLMMKKHLTLSVAESCTGGLICNMLTDIGGSSAYFERGMITYSNRSKVETLGVPPELLQTVGAVSEEVAKAMALGVREKAGTTIGLSTTGIAGPTGGTPEKPIGLVWIGYADGSTSFARKFLFGNQRVLVKERAAQAALELVWRKVYAM